jgi:HTH-type transcriptional regulator/antitoxin HigA
VKEYDALRAGEIRILKAANLSELPNILIRARIAHGLSQRDLAELVGIKEQQIQRYEAEEYASASLHRLSEIAEALRLNITEIAELKTKPSTTEIVSAGGLDWNKFPVKEMYRRQWFEGFSGSLSEALAGADTLVSDFVKRVIRTPARALHRKQVRVGSIVDDYALLAWECRILWLASKAELGHRYEDGLIDFQWVAELARESRKDNGPLCAKEKLAEAGIALVVEPHLVNTYLDGAALLHDKGPVIGLTLRYDRLDNFWFVLFHELFHIIKHLRKGKLEGIFDDLDNISTDTLTKKREDEANYLAGEALIPEGKWDYELARYIRTREAVIETAKNLNIHPAIVAGRIRREANNYIILNDLVGQGEVRKHFPDAGFGR